MAKNKGVKDEDKKYEEPNWEDLDEDVNRELEQENLIKKAKPILKKFEKAKNASGGRSDELVENMAFYEGKQYELERYKNQRPWVVRMNTPHAATAIDTRVASLIAEDYEGVLFPTAPEQREAVEVVQKLVRAEWARENVDFLIKNVLKQAAIVREGYTHVIWKEAKKGQFPDNRKGYIKAYNLENPASIFIDPSALNLKEARYVMLTHRKTYGEVIEEFPDLKGILVPDAGGFSLADRGETYLSSKDYKIEQEDVCTVITYYDYDKKGNVRKVIVVENLLASEKTLTGLKTFPIAQFRWKAEHNSPYGRALMDDLIMLQKAINAIESAITNTAVAYSAPSYAIRKGSGINPKVFSKLIGAPGYSVVVEGDPNTVFSALRVPELKQDILSAKNEFIEFIDRIAGITNPFLGSIGTAGNTAQGARITMDRARIIEADVLANLSMYVEDLTDIFIQYISTQYSDSTMVLRDTNVATGVTDFEEINVPEAVEDISYTYYINLNNKTKYSKEREKDVLMEIYQFEQQYDADIKAITLKDIVASFELENSEEILERYDLMSAEAMRAKSQLIMQITEVTGQLGIDAELVQAAITEIMMDVKPEKQMALPQLQELIAQMVAEQEQQAMAMQQAQAEAEQMMMSTPEYSGADDMLLEQLMQIMGGQAEADGVAPPEMFEPQLSQI